MISYLVDNRVIALCELVASPTEMYQQQAQAPKKPFCDTPHTYLPGRASISMSCYAICYMLYASNAYVMYVCIWRGALPSHAVVMVARYFSRETQITKYA